MPYKSDCYFFIKVSWYGIKVEKWLLGILCSYRTYYREKEMGLKGLLMFKNLPLK